MKCHLGTCFIIRHNVVNRIIFYNLLIYYARTLTSSTLLLFIFNKTCSELFLSIQFITRNVWCLFKYKKSRKTKQNAPLNAYCFFLFKELVQFLLKKACCGICFSELEQVLTVDGVYKLLFSINGEFPGPPIIVYEGQTVSIYLSINYFFLDVVHLITHQAVRTNRLTHVCAV